MHGSHNINIMYSLRGLHNLAYDNVNSAMVNGYDIMRSTFARNRKNFIGNARFENVYCNWGWAIYDTHVGSNNICHKEKD